MSRRVRKHTSLFSLALVLLAVPLWWSSRHTGDLSPHGEHTGFVVPPDFKVKLMRAGLDPSALAAAGVPSGSITSVLQAAADTMNASPSTLTSADAALASARVESDRLQARIQSGLSSQEERSAYQSASASLATATTQRQQALDSIFSTATANLSAGQRAALTQIRSNRAQDLSREFPIEFMVVERSQADWVALRDALANERLAVDYPDMESETARTNLATWRAAGAVAAAKESLNSNLASVTTSWNIASGQQ